MPPDAESSTIPMPVAVGPDEPLTPVALTPDALARLLIAAGGRAVTADMVQAAVDADAPVDVGGRGKLLEVVAWLEWDLVETRA